MVRRKSKDPMLWRFMEQGSPPDPCENRHGGNEQSDAAFEQIKDELPSRRRKVLEVIESSGQAGATVHDVCKALETTPNCVSGRLTELAASGLIADTGKRRDGCAVWVVRV